MFGTRNVSAQVNSAVHISIKKQRTSYKKTGILLGRDCLKFCGSHEFVLRGHDKIEESAN